MKKDTSWEKSHKWYHEKVGEKGHFYHQEVILPALIPLLQLSEKSSLIDLGCGQAILSRYLPKECSYVGIDLSPSLLKAAQKIKMPKNHQLIHADVTKKLSIEQTFSHGCFLLSLQNMDPFEKAILNASSLVEEGGRLVFVLNHPCFRIPRQSSWGIDESKNLQYRRIDSYLSFQKIPIQMEPGKKPEKNTYSFHFSLSFFSKALQEAELVIEEIQEWCSSKESSGKNARRENRARKEFPLFLAISTLRLPKKKKKLG